ncbi:hypothetical protein [Rhizobium sp. WYJ-E13]|uniref:hypothetical protein n=1 Tax=Rhizobium sp. WYJ-E13 TaxID=2849093 RepID=UPI001C1E9835|nr:hypothetical protein [Rhizobium sp. WYJ-E13]QWW70159.1 hypothetical protein KQ933_10885 [Rhizobium sp. WYJ-E13]
MTISTETNRSGPYSGDGTTTAFEYKFKILEPQHLQVIRTDASGADTILVLDADYTVTGVGNDGGGSAVITPAPAAGSKITLLLNVPFTQETDLENQGAYYAETVEQALDLIVMRLQQLKERAARAVTIPPSYDSATIDQLISNVLALSDKGAAIEAVAAVAQYLETVAGIADDIPAVADLTQIAGQKANEAAQSAAAANASANLSTAYANNPEDVQIPGSGGLFSSFHWYRKTLALYDSVAAGIAGMFHSSAAKADITDSDEFAIADSADGWALKKVLASSVVKYVCIATGFDFFTGFIPAYVGASSVTIGPGMGFFGGKKHQAAIATAKTLVQLLDTGSVQPSKTYFLYAIRKASDGTTDFVMSLSASEAGVTKPVGWECLSGSRVGLILTNSSGNVVPFWQTGNEVNTDTYAWFTANANVQGLAIPSNIPVGLSVDVSVQIDTVVAAPGQDCIGIVSDAAAANYTTGAAHQVRCRSRSGNDYPDQSAAAGKARSNVNGQLWRYAAVTSTACAASVFVCGWHDYTCKRLFA